jgi:hypothetical protein
VIKLERGTKMNKAIERAKAVRPFVKWLGERTYTVTSSDGQRVYTVRFEVANGHKLAECNCKAGAEGMLCYHIAAAAAVNIAVASMRQRTASPSIPAVSPTEQPSSAQAAAHVHICQACKQSINCEYDFCSTAFTVVCDGCYAAGKRVWDAPGPVYPPTVSNGAHALAC